MWQGGDDACKLDTTHTVAVYSAAESVMICFASFCLFRTTSCIYFIPGVVSQRGKPDDRCCLNTSSRTNVEITSPQVS